MTTPSRTVAVTASKDNPGGAQSTELALSSCVTVLAKAYVAKKRASERSA